MQAKQARPNGYFLFEVKRRAMEIVSSESIVLRNQDLGERDRLVTFITREHGRMTGVVKGSRKLTSRGVGNFEPFSHGVMHFAPRPGADLVNIRKCDPLPPYLYLNATYHKILYAGYLAELTDRFPVGEAEAPEFFALLEEALRLLCEAERERHLPLIRLRYELKLLDLLGLQPDWTRCSLCEAALVPEPPASPAASSAPIPALDVGTGGLLCPACLAGTEVMRRRSSVNDRVPLAQGSLDFLAGWRSGGATSAMRPTLRVLESLENAVTRHLLHHLERPPKSLALLPPLDALKD